MCVCVVGYVCMHVCACTQVQKASEFAQATEGAAAVLLTYFIHQDSHSLNALLRQLHLFGGVLGDDNIPTWDGKKNNSSTQYIQSTEPLAVGETLPSPSYPHPKTKKGS